MGSAMSKLTAQQAAMGYPWLSRVMSQRALLRGHAYYLAKRATDLSIIAASLPLTAPFFLLCALLIKLEDPAGPIFFIQERTGRGGRRFGMFKFRTMVAN